MGTGISCGEYIDAQKEKRFPRASRDRDVDCAIQVLWSDTGVSGGIEKLYGVRVALDKLEHMENWIIGKIKEDGKRHPLSITIDLGRGFTDTKHMRAMKNSNVPILQRMTLDGYVVHSLRITGEFDTSVTQDERVSWCEDFVKLSRYLGLTYEINARYQIDPIGLDQIGVDAQDDSWFVAGLTRTIMM